MVWRYEVQCLVNNPELAHQHSAVLQVVRSSLRGSARLMIVPLGDQAVISQVLEKLDALYAYASSREELMTEFFNSIQLSEESVTSFACRLETLLQTIINKGHLPFVAKNDLLRHKFWTGLHSDVLKLQTRHKYDYITNYNVLLREIRQVEKEITKPAIKSTSSAKKTLHNPISVEQLTQRLDKMESRFNEFEKTIETKFDSIMSKLDSKNGNYRHNRPRNTHSQSQQHQQQQKHQQHQQQQKQHQHQQQQNYHQHQQQSKDQPPL